MAFIDEINQHLESVNNDNSIINVKDNDVIIQIEKCLTNYIRYFINKNIKSRKLTGIIFVNNLCKITSNRNLRFFSQYKPSEFSENVHLFKMPITICCTSKPLDIIPEFYYVDGKVRASGETKDKLQKYTYNNRKIYEYIGFCNSFRKPNTPILYGVNNDLFLCPFAYLYDEGPLFEDTFDRCASSSEVKLENSIMNNYDDLIIKLSNCLQQWFVREGFTNNKVNLKTFNQVIPIKKVPCYKTGLFGKRKLIGEKEIISSDCNNKCIMFEVAW